MAASSLSRGSYLLVFPEDLNGSITSPVYAKISNARGTSVTACSTRMVTSGDLR
ncbi:hypothetical protein PF005_g23773 [Phytophthora fragariae]|uniref:Uncharacterized protein n=1 Tax=Phytophthora fragariae TaxID=53985 RepID=A0A6A3RKY8_9STRA|nr:hypothetical protein PF009_g24590 [Phytophthora fragariae]KAE8980865.1 hypothetical protein PF011_g22258 [Phytophthora fragariae]KAE9078737.1 hypothetical protein PF007_g23725 [Phytophthora fragariae]KAE9099413.1 hypothetical protein PF006_g23142 [Phytophthora fragariae]KAE9179193.1 hypothetical protein PF005_g23773 [Phytophthora fragariae]